MAEPTTTLPPSRPSRLVLAIGSGLGTGYAPIASGTFGSALAVAWCLIPGVAQTSALLPMIVVLLILGARVAGKMEDYYGPDPAEVTVDEVVGQWITVLFLPFSLPLLVAGFFLFRIFDIIKPYPARAFDRRRGGWPIMLDDVVAGIYANLVLQAAVRIGVFG
ncbi:MAG: phosphatidylglycerophosphatase A [Bacteroidetes bacterium]|jgi:phosphatidylglycerophosphatase A|nr:phosphatidylglycerophosphatase A [Bacteroidota bacterium]